MPLPVNDSSGPTPARRPWWLSALVILWASPTSLLGLLAGLGGLLTGGRVQRMGRTLEFHGGLVTWGLRHLTGLAGGASAMTLGHVILGRSRADLDRCRPHEAVHVAQCERWGPGFLMAYLACSAWLWLRGRQPYYDNPFEVEAYRRADPSG